MSFGPYKLLAVRRDDDYLVLHLGDEDGQVLYRPRRLLSFNNTGPTQQQANSLIGSMVVTETSNPTKNPPEKWWVRVRAHAQAQAQPTVEAPQERNKIVVPSGPGNTYEPIKRVASSRVVELRQLAEAGNADAQFELGSILDRADGVPRNLLMAVEWYQRAAVQGHAGARLALGLDTPQPALSSQRTVTLAVGHVHKIYGPPGTGKTSKLLELVEEALDRCVPPTKIGFFSHTNKATDEARQRMVQKFPKLDIEKDFPYFQTLHSLAYQSLRTRVAVISEQQARDFSEEVGIERVLMREGDESSRVTRVKHPVLDASSTARAKKIPLKRYLENLPESQRWPIHKWRGRRDWERPLEESDIQACVHYDERYEAHKRRLGVIDYTDMIELALRDDAALPTLQLLLIDEAQDLNPLQWDLARLLMARAERCYIAGDDDQAICEPFGASARDFVELPVGAGNEQVLETSRRVPAAIHEALEPLFQRLSQKFPYRKDKAWYPKAGALRGKVSRFSGVGAFLESGILAKHVAQSRDALLMFATNSTLQNVSRLLKDRGVSHFAAHELVGHGLPVVRLLTVWGAKGGEAPLAVLIAESEMDRKMLRDDPRLEYVAHTRAQEEYCCVGLELPNAAIPQPRMSAPPPVTPSAAGNSLEPSPQSLELQKQKFDKSFRFR